MFTHNPMSHMGSHYRIAGIYGDGVTTFDPDLAPFLPAYHNFLSDESAISSVADAMTSYQEKRGEEMGFC